MPQARRNFNNGRRPLSGNKMHVFQNDGSCKNIAFVANDQSIVRRIDRNYIPRLAIVLPLYAANAKTASLPNGVKRQTFVRADHAAINGFDRARFK